MVAMATSRRSDEGLPVGLKVSPVEQTVSANLCVLSTRPDVDVTDEMSLVRHVSKLTELDISDPKLHEVQALDHEDHIRKAICSRQKRKAKQKQSIANRSSSNELAERIDANAKALMEKIATVPRPNSRKRKAAIAMSTVRKRRRTTMSKEKVRKASHGGKSSIMKCFDRRGGKHGRVHTHLWWELV